jgi:hypothetical protein
MDTTAIIALISTLECEYDREAERRRINKRLPKSNKVTHAQVGTTAVWQSDGDTIAANRQGDTVDATDLISSARTNIPEPPAKAKKGEVRKEKATNGKVRTNADWNKAFDAAFRLAAKEGVGRQRAGKKAYGLCRHEGHAPTVAAKMAVAALKEAAAE